MAGTIIIPLGDQFRYAEFFMDYSNLDAPEGTRVSLHRSSSVVENLNMSLSELAPEHEWVWFMADDHLFPRNLLKQLLAHDVDVVVPLVVRRTPPFHLLIMKERTDLYDDRMGKNYPGYLPYEMGDVPDDLFTVVAAGSGGMLVRRRVIDEIGFPWFENSDGVYLNEDFRFCDKIREAGFDIWCDPHAYLGHIGQMHVWPDHKEGQLAVKIDCGGPAGTNEVWIGERARAAAA